MSKSPSQTIQELLQKVADNYSWNSDNNWLEQKPQSKSVAAKPRQITEEQAMALHGKHVPQAPMGKTPRQTEHEMYVAQAERSQRKNPNAPVNPTLQSRIEATGKTKEPVAPPVPGVLAMRTKRGNAMKKTARQIAYEVLNKVAAPTPEQIAAMKAKVQAGAAANQQRTMQAAQNINVPKPTSPVAPAAPAAAPAAPAPGALAMKPKK